VGGPSSISERPSRQHPVLDTGLERADTSVPVIDLAAAPGERAAWDRPPWAVYLWAVVELLVVTNPWQISSGLRVRVLRLFGSRIGDGVVFRPRTRVKFPWKLEIGARCWIGEGVWFHNQDQIRIGHDVVISQETLLTTGSHAHRRDMALITRPIVIDEGVWVTSRCVVLGGTHMGRSALARPMTVVSGEVPPNTVVAGPFAEPIGPRFDVGSCG
jgi:putative colanic acid biosynthesis acetyltransferase WcaF